MEILVGSEIDNDQSKHVYARLEKDFKHDLKIGVNGGNWQLHESIRKCDWGRCEKKSLPSNPKMESQKSVSELQRRKRFFRIWSF